MSTLHHGSERSDRRAEWTLSGGLTNSHLHIVGALESDRHVDIEKVVKVDRR